MFRVEIASRLRPDSILGLALRPLGASSSKASLSPIFGELMRRISTDVQPPVTVRDETGELVDRTLTDLTSDVLCQALPYRTFRWYRGQRHYSGSYWSSTNCAHVIYESRLELARLLLADFDTSVTKIVAQPFLLRALIDGKMRRHIPDYCLLTRDAPIVVDVKPLGRMAKPTIRATFAWTRELMESIGWRFEVANEMPEALLANVRFLSGFRRTEGISQPCLADLRALDIDGVEFRDVKRMAPYPEPLVRAAILHLLWKQELVADLTDVLDSKTVLRRPLEKHDD
jgi:hypothetical protein